MNAYRLPAVAESTRVEQRLFYVCRLIDDTSIHRMCHMDHLPNTSFCIASTGWMFFFYWYRLKCSNVAFTPMQPTSVSVYLHDVWRHFLEKFCNIWHVIFRYLHSVNFALAPWIRPKQFCKIIDHFRSLQLTCHTLLLHGIRSSRNFEFI